MMVSFVLSFFPRDVLDEILNLIESVSEDFPSYSHLNEAAALISFLYSLLPKGLIIQNLLSLLQLVSCSLAAVKPSYHRRVDCIFSDPMDNLIHFELF